MHEGLVLHLVLAISTTPMQNRPKWGQKVLGYGPLVAWLGGVAKIVGPFEQKVFYPQLGLFCMRAVEFPYCDCERLM